MRGIRPLWDEMPLRPWEGKLRQISGAEPQKRQGETTLVRPFAEVFNTAIARQEGEPAEPITDLFRTAVAAVRETDADKVQMEYLMATGQLDNPALLTTALTKAQLSVNLLVELRNKATDAYNELIRISL